MKKIIGLINAAEIEMSPYVKTYMETLDSIHANYVVVEWRRDLQPIEASNNRCPFNYSTPIRSNKIAKFWGYWKFARFVESIIREKKISFLVVFDYQLAFFLKACLVRDFNQSYIIDVRDYNSVFPYIKGGMKDLDRHMYARVISSMGYKEWLHSVHNEILCHNVSETFLALFNNSVSNVNFSQRSILTIGSLRTYQQDAQIVKALTRYGYSFTFAGYGPESELYEKLSQSNNSVTYIGRYQKNEEIKIAQQFSFINIFLADNMCYNTAMSNRFYLSIISGIPMIVNSQNIQSKYVSKYYLGVVADSIDDIQLRITEFVQNFDFERYRQGRTAMLEIIKDDILIFKRLIKTITNGD